MYDRIIYVLFCLLLTVSGDNIYQQRKHIANLKYSNAPDSLHVDFEDAVKIGRLLDMENLMNNIDLDDLIEDDMYNISMDITSNPTTRGTTGYEVSSTSKVLNTELETTLDVKTKPGKITKSKTTKYGGIPTIEPTRSTSVVYNVSTVCMNHTKEIIAGLVSRKTWALQMIDAAGKPEAGLMTRHINWRGDYDECLGVHVSETTYELDGQYCNVLVGDIKHVVINPLTRAPLGVNIGLCLPKSCSNEDTKDLLNSVIHRLSNYTYGVITASCVEKMESYDQRAIIVLVVISVFIAVMTIATVYDVIVMKMSKSKSQSKTSEEILQNGGTKHNDMAISKTNGGFAPDENGGSENKYKLSGENNVELPTFEDHQDTKEPYKPGMFGRLLLSFSVYTNGAKILSTHQGSGTLTAINGIRFISMTWVILGHTYGFGTANVANIATRLPELLSRKSFMAIANAEVSVDTFFALSGCLLTYLFLRQMEKENGKINWFMFYFHRFWRLTPPYMLVMMVYLALFPYLGEGPMWVKDGAESNFCEGTWWYNLLYINNFISNECFAWAWYLAIDMQFYVISPIILVPLFYSKIAGTVIAAAFLLGTSVATGIVSTHFELGVSTMIGNTADYFDQYYIKPYTRMGPYLVGMYTGYILYKTKCKCKINTLLNLVLWAVFAVIALTVLYGVYEAFQGNPPSTEVAALYNTLHKTAWGASICWVIFSCATGNGGFVNTLLSWKGFIPLSRLTYCAYLIHPPVMYYYVSTRKSLVYWDDVEVIYEFLGNLGLSYAAAFVTSLAFESPMMGLEKVIFKRGEKK